MGWIRPIPSVSWSTHSREITVIFKNYLSEAGLEIDHALDLKDFLPRLIHGGMNQFGVILDLLLDGLEEALRAEDDSITVRHYADAYRRKTSCTPSLNPFLAADWRAIDTRSIPDFDENEDDQ